MTVKSYPIKRPITVLFDHLIIEQLPKSIIKKLGAIQESGFHLSLGRRDLFFEGGSVAYILGSSQAQVELS